MEANRIVSYGEITAGILVGNLVCFPRFFNHYTTKYKTALSRYTRSTSSTRLSNGNGRNEHSPSWPQLRPGENHSAWRSKRALVRNSGDYFDLDDYAFRRSTYPGQWPRSFSECKVGSAKQDPETFSGSADEADVGQGVWRTIEVEQTVHSV